MRYEPAKDAHWLAVPNRFQGNDGGLASPGDGDLLELLQVINPLLQLLLEAVNLQSTTS